MTKLAHWYKDVEESRMDSFNSLNFKYFSGNKKRRSNQI